MSLRYSSNPRVLHRFYTHRDMATKPTKGSVLSFWRVCSFSNASTNATATGDTGSTVPPSVCSYVTVDMDGIFPSFSRSTIARRLRPINRWISMTWLFTFGGFALGTLVGRACNIPYSAVIQPLPVPLSQRGVRLSILAVHSTLVSP